MTGWGDGQGTRPGGAASSGAVEALDDLARELQRHAEAVELAVGRIAAGSADLAWSSPAAALMRSRAEECTADLRGTAAALREAAQGVYRHLLAYRAAEADLVARAALPSTPGVLL